MTCSVLTTFFFLISISIISLGDACALNSPRNIFHATCNHYNEDLQLAQTTESEDILPSSSIIHTLLTSSKGLAVFARLPILAGTSIIIEPPLFSIRNPEMVTDQGYPLHEMITSITTAFNALSKSQKEEYLGLHNFRHPEEPHTQGASGRNLVTIFRTNAYNTGPGRTGMFPKIARINHSCSPNAGNHWSEKRGERVIYALRDIKKGEEITVSYIPHLKNKKERQKRLAQYGFECACEACSTEDLKGSDRRRWKISEGLDDLQWKREVKGKSVNEKLAAKAEKLIKMIEEEEVREYLPRALELARVFGEKIGKFEEWLRREREMERWMEGESI